MSNERSGSEQRRSDRHDFTTFTWFKRVDDGASESEEGVARSCDISGRGAGLVTTQELPAGARVFLEIASREGKVSAVARVMHCSPAEDGCFRIGLLVYCVPPTDLHTWRRMLGE